MAGEMLVDYAAMTTAAHQESEAADRVHALDSDRQAATLPSGSLGRLPSSEEIQAGFDEVWASAGDALEALGRACEGLSDRLIGVRDLTREVDDTVTQTFDQARGAS